MNVWYYTDNFLCTDGYRFLLFIVLIELWCLLFCKFCVFQATLEPRKHKKLIVNHRVNMNLNIHLLSTSSYDTLAQSTA